MAGGGKVEGLDLAGVSSLTERPETSPLRPSPGVCSGDLATRNVKSLAWDLTPGPYVNKCLRREGPASTCWNRMKAGTPPAHPDLPGGRPRKVWGGPLRSSPPPHPPHPPSGALLLARLLLPSKSL